MISFYQFNQFYKHEILCPDLSLKSNYVFDLVFLSLHIWSFFKMKSPSHPGSNEPLHAHIFGY